MSKGTNAGDKVRTPIEKIVFDAAEQVRRLISAQVDELVEHDAMPFIKVAIPGDGADGRDKFRDRTAASVLGIFVLPALSLQSAPNVVLSPEGLFYCTTTLVGVPGQDQRESLPDWEIKTTDDYLWLKNGQAAQHAIDNLLITFSAS